MRCRFARKAPVVHAEREAVLETEDDATRFGLGFQRPGREPPVDGPLPLLDAMREEGLKGRERLVRRPPEEFLMSASQILHGENSSPGNGNTEPQGTLQRVPHGPALPSSRPGIFPLRTSAKTFGHPLPWASSVEPRGSGRERVYPNRLPATFEYRT